MSFGLYIAFRIMSHSILCRIQDYVAFRIMLFRIMTHLGLCRIRYSVIQDCVVRVNVTWLTVVHGNVIGLNVSVSSLSALDQKLRCI